MPIDVQTRLLRVLQDGEYTTVGGREPLKADARIIAATHRFIATDQTGRLSRGSFYRLNVVPISLPPLRDRTEDIKELVEHFFVRGLENGLRFKTIEPEAMALMMRHSWSGNVRELENLVQRLAALYPDDKITAEIIREELSKSIENQASHVAGETFSEAMHRHLQRAFVRPAGVPSSGLYMRVLHEIERPLISLTLNATRGNQLRAAEILD